MCSIFIVATALFLILKVHEKRTLVPYFKAERSFKLSHFSEARSKVAPSDIPMLELWESMLTGRVAPLDRWLRKEYKALALAHVFTPSGFHLSAILWPVLLLFRKKRSKTMILAFIGSLLLFVSGQSALKRMTMIKLNQQYLGLKTGFIIALLADILFGSFSDSPLGFTYSFLFLGIIYSGARGLTLFVWFFLAQILIAYIQGSLVSPLLLFISPFINSALALALPFLFLLSFPLWSWQLSAGLTILKVLQFFVSTSYSMVMRFPLLEVNVILLLLFIFLLMRQGRLAIFACLILTADLNTDLQKIPVSGSYEWVASGRIIKTVGQKIYREDGICERELIRGMWFETCSPRRRSRKKRTS
jgi:hypothetical protein